MNLISLYEKYIDAKQKDWLSMLLIPFLNEYCRDNLVSYEITGPQGNGSRVYVTFTDQSYNSTFIVVFEPDVLPVEKFGSVMRVLQTGIIDSTIAQQLIHSSHAHPVPSIGVDMHQEINTIALLDMAYGG